MELAIVSCVAGVASAVVDVGSCSVALIQRPMYLYNYRTNFDKLEQEVRNLKVARDEVKRKVDAAENNLEEIKQNVNDWRDKVNKIIHEAEELIRKKANNYNSNFDNPVARDEVLAHENVNPDEAEKLTEEKENNPCFMRCCLSLMTRYKHSKEASRKVEVIARLVMEETTFVNVSHPTTRKDIRLINNGFEEFETRRSNLDDVLNALKDAKVGMVGVYGMGGIGKTTLVREVGKVAEEDKLFEKVIFLEVTDTPDIKKIQDDIANNLGLQFDNETERASKLYERLKKGQKILVILDNIWEYLNLETVGIPVGVDRGGCKLLLTARYGIVLSNMESEKNIRMGILNEEEAWRLFMKKIAGDFVGQGELKSLAEEVCKNCGGLPIAIVTVAKALSNKRDPSIWRAALEQFKRPSPENFEGDLKLPYLSIELSYKSLRGKELKKTFLLCSLMGHEASILDLLKYAMGLNIFEDICTMQKARDRACKFISELKDSCLLLEGHTSESFSMHDFVREVAITIAKRDNHVFSVRNDTDQWEWPGRDKQKNFTKIFIRDSTISGLHEELKCPKLESFFINTNVNDNYEVVEIPHKFFAGMTELKVLYLIRIQLFSLRLSLHLLKDLQTLCLDFCKFEDVAFIGELECLKILSLRGSMVEELPIEIAQLTKLRLLDLSYCRQLKVIAPKVISSLLRLEELYMSGCFVEWETEVHNVKRSNASLEELKHLSKLTTLELDIKDDKILPQGLFSKELKRYKISIGDGSSEFGWGKIYDDRGNSMYIDSFSFEEQYTFRTLRTLKLKHNFIICLEELQGFNNVEFLCLDKLEGIQNVLYELNKEGFSQLKHLRVHNNPNLLCIVETRGPHNAFPALESLILFNLIKLDTVCFGQPKETSFQKLKIIEVQACGRLKHLFSFSNIAKSLPQLQRINVNDCPNMEEIFAIESEDTVNSHNEILAIESEDNVSNRNEINLCQLRIVSLKRLSRLAGFCSEVKTHSTSQRREMKSMPLFNEKVVFPNLEVLNLEKVNMEKIWDNQLSTSMSSSCQNLTSLTIIGCEKLKYVFPFSMVESFKQLQYLQIRDCEVLEELFWKGEREKEDAKVEWPMLKKLKVEYCERLEICTLEDKVVFPNLEDLELFGIKIEKIWDSKLQTIMSSFYQNLTRLTIWGCEKLKYVFPSSMVESLKQLQHLVIYNCKVLEEIVLKGGADQAIVKFEFPQVTSLKLQFLPDLTAFYLGTHTSEWPMLKELDVYKCDKLQIFTSEYKFVSPNLEHLILNGIDSEFTTLHIYEWPMLKKLGVCGCAKVKIFFQGQPDKPQSLASHEKMNHNLEELILGGKNIMMIQRGLFPENLLCRIKVFEIEDDKSANIPLEIVQRFNNLEKLRLFNSSYKEMLSCGEEVTHTGILAQIKGLELERLSYMKYLWKQDSNLNSLLQNLEFLEVFNCQMLINVVPPLASFQNLTVLKVEYCNRLMNVITSSTAKSLGQLREMEIKRCKMLIEIVENGGDAAKEVIDFSKLEKLSLENLESLTCFCFGNYTFNFPSLEELIVKNCPKMKTFFEGDLSTPTLQKVKEGSWDSKGCWKGNLNTTIQQLHKKRVNSNLKELTLSGRDITPMWQGQLPENFCELEVLEVIKDESANIPIGILQRFNNLEQLILKGSSYKEMFSCGDDVKNVGMLTHIKILKLSGLFNLKNMWKKDPQLSILQNLETLEVQYCHSMINLLPFSASFGNLITLEVQCCDGLINMLTSSMAKTLVQLEKMNVRQCEKMTEVVANEGDEEKDEIVFNKLKSMSLEYLASLTSFGFGNYTIKFPALEELIVDKCPKMKTFFEGDLSTPTLQKVKESAFTYPWDKGCWEGDLNKTIQQLHKKWNIQSS